MKKFIFIIAIAIGMIANGTISAQTTTMKTTLTGTKAVDTTDNTESNYLYFKLTNTNEFSIQVNATKISGTPNGAITLEFSNDGTNYAAISVADTVHVSNVTPTATSFFTKTPTPYLYCRLKSVGRGTASYKFDAYIYPKK